MSGLILIAEDDEPLREMVALYMQRKGYLVVQAADGREAMDKAKAHMPDVILLDVSMPIMDGWQFAQELRAIPSFALTPIIFVTAMPARKSMVDGFMMGGLDYVPKPFHLDDLARRVEKALNRRREVEAAVRAQALGTDEGQNSALRTRLNQVSLASLLSILEMERRSGLLRVRNGDAAGELDISGGLIHRVRITKGSSETGMDALVTMVAWTDGVADFEVNDGETPNELNMPTTHLVMEAMRRLDESRR